LHAEKDIRLRIDLLEGQSSLIAKMLTRATSEHNEVVFAEYAKRLAVNRGRIEELLWVLGEKNIAGQSILDMQVTNKKNDISLPVREVIEKLRKGELTMDELSSDTQTMVRKGAMEIKNAKKAY
jgi:Ni,Fe-hydrogenase I large subunit